MKPNDRTSVAGMGRSGVAVALAAAKRGSCVRVYDEQSADTPEKLAIIEKLEAAGVEVVQGWHGRLVGEEIGSLVASPGFRRNHPAILDAQAAHAEVISEVEFAYRIARAPIIAITGTNGKSTTTVLAWLMLNAATSGRAVLCGNISGSGYPELTLTEAADASDEEQYLVAEVSSYQLEWVSSFRPRVAAITNISPDHFDRHPNFEDYALTKLKVFAHQTADDYAIRPENEPSLWPQEPMMADAWRRALSAGQRGATGNVAVQGSTFRIAGQEVSTAELPLLGEHNIRNAALAADLVCAALGEVSTEQAARMLEALRSFQGLEHRMERVGQKNGVLVVNNSMCTNPAAVVASSKGLPMRQWLLVGGNPKNLDLSPIGRHAQEAGHTLLLFGPDLDSLRVNIGGDWAGYETLEEAFEAAVAQANPGEAILLSPGCASAAPYLNFRERGLAFKSMAKEWLES